jgi:ligand-binding sensor domain-containing protein
MQAAAAPASDVQVWTSSARVTAIASAPDGSIWLGTGGGVLRRSADGEWQKWTRAEGLPSHEILSVHAAGTAAIATTPRGVAEFGDSRWFPAPDAPAAVALRWRDARVERDLHEIRLVSLGGVRSLPMPDSPGTHFGAVAVWRGALVAGIYGDGVWRWNGEWVRLDLALPDHAREITALYGHGEALWLGTRRHGVWEHRAGLWIAHDQPNEPPDHNSMRMTLLDDALAVSTHEDGLALLRDGRWTVLPTSSRAPREIVMVGAKRYLRYGNGLVFELLASGEGDELRLPRRQASAIAAEGDRLFAAQWGGWSELAGDAWRHTFDVPELEGTPTTSILPDGERLWIGTQGRGAIVIERKSGAARRADERHGLPDDWVTVLARIEGQVWAGTFVGGLARWADEAWETVEGLEGEEITAIVAAPGGGAFVGTRNGVWRVRDRAEPLDLPMVDPEVQTLLATPRGLWIGTRTGIFFLPGE